MLLKMGPALHSDGATAPSTMGRSLPSALRSAPRDTWRILLTLEYPFDAANYGGGQQIARGIARALARAGHEVHVACNGRDELGVVEADKGVNYHFSGRYHHRNGGFQVAQLALRLLRDLRPELVCSFTSEALLVLPAARARGIRAVAYIAAPKLRPFARMSSTMLRDVRYDWGQFLQFLGTAAADRVLTLSDFLGRQAHSCWRVPARRIRAVGTGLDEGILASVPVPPRPLPVDGAALLSVGRIVFLQKPLQLVASALAEIPGKWSTWTIVGPGTDTDNLKRHVEELGIADRVRFLGARQPEEVRREIDAADIVVLPSHYESFFITVYEAVACARVVVTNDVADIRRDFESTPSVVCASTAEPTAYRDALLRAIDRYEHCSAGVMATAASVRERHTWPAVIARILAAVDG